MSLYSKKWKLMWTSSTLGLGVRKWEIIISENLPNFHAHAQTPLLEMGANLSELGLFGKRAEITFNILSTLSKGLRERCLSLFMLPDVYLSLSHFKDEAPEWAVKWLDCQVVSKFCWKNVSLTLQLCHDDSLEEKVDSEEKRPPAVEWHRKEQFLRSVM